MDKINARIGPFGYLNRIRVGVSSPQQAIFILAVLYLVGIAGVIGQIHEDFLLLTPVNLLISLSLVLFHHPVWNRRMVVFLALCYAVGFGSEWFGVQTGLLFGSYQYDYVLGWKLWDTPLIIGINWIIVTYCSAVAVQQIWKTGPWWAKASVSALLMVGLDVFIEPVAMRYGFWSWEDDTVPFRNYIGWFVVALPLQLVFHGWLPAVKNKVAVALLIMQFIFFLILGLI